ncbi:hypothetical protein Bcav_1211 [Beutenbergia cavernae DSM 12333]|uniref:Uncharacterized protein n=1 Tax=Beutenbergia cavernae (strain ATCC BAA-8 / DSM 12333 / CCUG 43141 / JCM 11478 / NBRC 16432 / NCIMB 13614 / HKI 0122) TaxID=471853 RepID=C5C167_BEUC1|nr:hypothetical protein [Beutenbergia cavernae]ACQ79471.1 hypothetical protein Bcav_1211 [Beutenbergia cavernae DSM 12333]
MTSRRHPSRYSPTSPVLRATPTNEQRHRDLREAELAERRLDRIHADAATHFGRF